MSDAIVGVDVGGTTIAAGLVLPGGEVVADTRRPARASDGALAAITGLVDDLCGTATARGLHVRGVGIGVPGPVDTVTGLVGDHVPHAPDLAGVPLGTMLTSRFARPTYVDNDVNALALGEWWFGGRRAGGSLVVLAPGTGFGCGIVLDGRLLRGAAGFGGEFGHTPVKFDGPRCWCGGRGCLALYASGRGLADAARARLVPGPLLSLAGGDPAAITGELVFRAAGAGDALATALVGEACQALGAMVGTIVNGLNPESIVITGGVAGSLVALQARILAAAGEYAFPRALAATRLSVVPGDKRITMRGAAALVLYEEEARR